MLPLLLLLLGAARADSEFYPGFKSGLTADQGPEPDDYIIENLARLLRQQQGRAPEFSFSFPQPPSSGFAVPPSDPRFYARPWQDDPELQAVASPKLHQETSTTPKAVDAFTEEPDEEAPSSMHVVQTRVQPAPDDDSDLYFIAIVAGCSASAVVGIIAIGISWYKLQKSAKAAADVEYPAYGVTGPNKEASPTGDRRLAQSAHMYHYQHQKQQIIAMESRVPNERNGSVSEAESEEENEEGDYTVYECPGLASTGEMEVKNPLFHDDPTPASPAVLDPKSEGKTSESSQKP